VIIVAAKIYGRWLIAGTMLFGGACAPLAQPPLAGTELAPGPSISGGTERLFSFAFQSIRDRYLDSVDLSDASVEGLRGLATIEPTILVGHRDSKVEVEALGRLIASYPAPGADDYSGWARLTVSAILDLQKISPELRNAEGERIGEAVIDATLAKLDRFSRYSGSKEAREKRANRNGFGGIGIRFEDAKDGILILEVMPDSPASRAGMQAGQKLTQVDGASIIGLERGEITRLLRGTVGSEVILGVVTSDGETRDYNVRRALVVPPTVTLAMVDGIAQVKISSFNQRTARSLEDILTPVLKGQQPTAKGVLLDLRGNPGGLLDQAVIAADLFMARGQIVSTKGRHPNSFQAYDAQPGDIGENVPLVVVVDGKSASAAEILASALQDSGRAVVVGTNSYGKGTVQTVIRMPNDGEMTLTWSRFYSPAGYALHGLGVLPQICTTAEQKPTSTGLLSAVRDGGLQRVSNSLAVWRTAAIEATDLRSSLRSTCPSEPHGAETIDVEIAANLLTDPALYARALAVGAPINHAQLPTMSGAPPVQPVAAQRH
jgi:carboxyl-terminal processing protease